MASIHANGHAGDTAQFFDSPGNDTFYAYADYNNSGQPLAGMVRQRVFQLGQRLRHQHRLFDQRRQRYGLFLRFAGQRHVLCLRGLQQQRQALGGHVRQHAAIPTRPAASPPTSPIRPTAAAIRPCSSTRRATTRTMPTRITTTAASPWPACTAYGGGYSNSASGFGRTSDIRPTAAAIRPCSSTRRATTRSMPTRITTTAASPWRAWSGSGVFQFGQRLRHERRLFDQRRQRYGRVLRFAGQRHVLCLRRLQQQRPALGRHVRHRLFQFGQRFRHQRRICDRRQCHGRSVRFIRQQYPLHEPGDRPALRQQLCGGGIRDSRSSTPPAAAA